MSRTAPYLLSKFEQLDRGEAIAFPALRPCRLKILIVVDGVDPFFGISFSHSYFGLSTVLDALRENPEFFARFDVTRAHRQTDAMRPDPALEPELDALYGPHYEQFRFDQPGFDLDEFDEVWLFGMRASENDVARLTDAELEILATWMDNGGGLFATGDHEDLGASLCSRVPRAGTMRKWTMAQSPPPQYGPDRHDTLLPGHDAIYTFDDESDDIPMPIRLAQYRLPAPLPFPPRFAPHPVLCGTTGPIDVLPDHPHEGEVLTVGAIDLTRQIAVGAYTGDEYPTTGPTQARPEVVAWASVRPDHTATGDQNKFAANPKEFPVIGAYNGHSAGVGRVVVDSTWHHWFDVNLTGRPIGLLNTPPPSAANPKAQGFLASPAGDVALAKIQNYFRNVALWCAPEAKQQCMLLRATWGSIIRYPAAERLRPDAPIWQLGATARDAIGRRSSQCMVTSWLVPQFPLRWREIFEMPVDIGPIPTPPDPCLTCPPWDVVEIYALGGATRVLLEFLYERQLDQGRSVGGETVAELFVAGLRQGIAQLVDDYTADAEEMRHRADELAELAQEIPVRRDFAHPADDEEPERPDPRTR